MKEFEFDWEVLEILNKGRFGAMVKYTPLDTELTALERFVPVPWHKCRDIDHARETMEKKINAYAPINDWQRALATPIKDNSEAITTELARSKLKGEQRETDLNAERGAD